jgi:cytochrome c553
VTEIIMKMKTQRGKLSDEDLTGLEKQFERVQKKAQRNGNNAGTRRGNRVARAFKGKRIQRG